MKKLVIAVILLVVLIIVVVGGGLVYAVTNANAIAKQYKPELEKMAGEALGSKVTFGEISASVFPTAKLVVDDTRVESDGQAMTLENLTLRVALMPLLERTLQVQELVLDTPKITVYLEKDGFYIAGLPRNPPEKSESPEPSAAGDAASELAPLNVRLDQVALKNATIAIVDKVADAEYVVEDLNVNAGLGFANNVVTLRTLDGAMVILDDVKVAFGGKNTTLNLDGGAFQIEQAEASTLGNTFKVTGGIDPDDPKKALRLTSDRVDLASLGPLYDVFAPGFNDLGITGQCATDMNVAWTPEGAYRANGTVSLSNAAWTVADIPLHDIAGTLDLDATNERIKVATSNTKGVLRDAPFTMQLQSGLKDMNAGLETMTVNIFDGTATLKTEAKVEGDMPFTSNVKVSGMKIEQILPALLPDTPSNVTGTVTELGANVSGTLNENLMPSIAGKANMHLSDGLIKDVNIGKEVLAKVTEIPFISGALLSVVPDSLIAFVEKKHTVLESVSGSFDIAQETLTTQDLIIESDFFRLEGKGTIGFDTDLDLDAVIYFAKNFSDGLAGTTKELRYLFNDEGRLAFPVKISGVPPNLIVVPDVGDLVKRAATGAIKEEGVGRIKEEANKLLRGVLGGDKTEATPEGEAAPDGAATAAPQEEEKKQEGGLLRRFGIRPPNE